MPVPLVAATAPTSLSIRNSGMVMAMTELTKSVYAAHQRTQTLSAEHERTIDRA